MSRNMQQLLTVLHLFSSISVWSLYRTNFVYMEKWLAQQTESKCSNMAENMLTVKRYFSNEIYLYIFCSKETWNWFHALNISYQNTKSECHPLSCLIQWIQLYVFNIYQLTFTYLWTLKYDQAKEAHRQAFALIWPSIWYLEVQGIEKHQFKTCLWSTPSKGVKKVKWINTFFSDQKY
jgi:hypothetical protein